MENEETVCSGNEIEMKTVGGEVAFITSMILDSLILKERSVSYYISASFLSYTTFSFLHVIV
jgi:hypothetical protein